METLYAILCITSQLAVLFTVIHMLINIIRNLFTKCINLCLWFNTCTGVCIKYVCETCSLATTIMICLLWTRDNYSAIIFVLHKSELAGC